MTTDDIPVTCDDVIDALYALIDCEECAERTGLIDSGAAEGPGESERLVLLAHATGCAHCSDALESERHLRSLVRGAFDEAEPADLRERIKASLTRAPFRE